MKLAAVPYYDGPDNAQSPPAWKLVRTDVVDLGCFVRAVPVSKLASFPDEYRAPEPMVRMIFSKARSWEQYTLPLSEFGRVLGTELRPDLA